MAGVREKRLNEILLALGCTVWQSDIPSTSNRVIRRLIGPPSPPLSLFLSLVLVSLYVTTTLFRPNVHQASNVLHQFFSSFLFLPPRSLARLLRRFADYSARRRERERKKEKGKACRLQAGRETG